MENALALIQPPACESLEIVLLEAFMAGTANI